MEWINVAKESLEFAFASISVGALVYGAWIGGKAVKKYQMQNEIDAKYSLIAADNEIFAVVRSKPFLESFLWYVMIIFCQKIRLTGYCQRSFMVHLEAISVGKTFKI